VRGAPLVITPSVQVVQCVIAAPLDIIAPVTVRTASEVLHLYMCTYS
jgi:hypothetical protein